MQRTALCVLLACLACGGAPTAPPTASPAAPAVDPETPVIEETSAAPVDPALAARRAHRNPGGMWLPGQMTHARHVETLQRLGVTLPASALADPLAAPLGAIVMVGGCSASFVSPRGLLITNHHCVQGALQLNSTPQQNLVENGFLAKTPAEEKSAGPAQRVMVARAFRDVTTELRDGLAAIADPVARKTEHDARLKRLQSACEKDRPGLRCEVRSFFRGALYLLIEYLEIRDVRLVYAPKRSIGNYGGEIDNWAWPRHTGDFSFYRAYVGKDGKPADYSPDNVPFTPAHSLRVSTTGVRPADVVIVAGYPGVTSRVTLASEVRHDAKWRLPTLIGFLQQRYAIVEKLLASGGDTAIKAGVAKQGIQNGLERFQGMLAGIEQRGLTAKKDAADALLLAWAAAPGREEHRRAIDRLEALLAADRRVAAADFERNQLATASSLLAVALTSARLAEERTKRDADRRPGYQERDMPRLLAGQKQVTRQYDAAMDRAFLRLALVRALALPAAERPWLAAVLGAAKGQRLDEAAIDRALDRLYAGTKLVDEAGRLALLSRATPASLRASRDPFVAAATRLWPFVREADKAGDASAGELLLVSDRFATAMRESMDGFLAPDANSTLRVSYGTVRSFRPDSTDPADAPFTFASELLTKDKGEEPFDAPAAVLAAIRTKKYGPYAPGGELPVNFLTDMDTTGGNSGSAILDSKGELVGLHFDRPLTAVASDIVFDNEVSRTISLDVRYMLWMMDAVDGADHLLVEMGVSPSIP